MRNRRPNNTVECPYCGGAQEVFDSRGWTSSMNPPYTTCPACNGRGWVYDDEDIDCDKSVREYAQENKEEADLQRWESKQDR
jgi:DnaJ-class molecular chaperone